MHRKISVEWGCELHSVELTEGQWQRIISGKEFEIHGVGFHCEDEFFQDRWIFDGGLSGNLRVEYGEGVDAGIGYNGPLNSANFEPPLSADQLGIVDRDDEVTIEAVRSGLSEKFFERATYLRMIIGHIDMAVGLGLGDQNGTGFHLEQVYLLLEKASKIQNDEWCMLVCDGLVRIDTADIGLKRVLVEAKIQAILSSASRLRQSLKADDPSWIAFSLIENIAALSILKLKTAHPQINLAEESARRWIFEDIEDFGFEYKMAMFAAQNQQKAPLREWAKRAFGTFLIVGGIFSFFYGWTLYPPIFSSIYWTVFGLNGDDTVEDYKNSDIDTAVKFSMNICNDGVCLPAADWMCGFTVADTIKFELFDDFGSVEEAVNECFSDVTRIAPGNMKLDNIRKLCGRHYSVFDPSSTGVSPKDCEKAEGNWAIKPHRTHEEKLLLIEAGIAGVTN